MKTMIRAAGEPWSYEIAIRMAQENSRGELFVAQPVAFAGPHARGTMVEPMMRLQREDAQLLMDELWNAGLRPSEGTGSAGAMAATERHLKDMQAIATGALKKAGVL